MQNLHVYNYDHGRKIVITAIEKSYHNKAIQNASILYVFSIDYMMFLFIWSFFPSIYYIIVLVGLMFLSQNPAQTWKLVTAANLFDSMKSTKLYSVRKFLIVTPKKPVDCIISFLKYKIGLSNEPL